MSFKNELESYIASGYPLLAIATPEELRAQMVVKEVAEKLERDLYLWSVTRGILRMKNDDDNVTLFKDTNDPISALSWLERNEFTKNFIIVFFDFHHYWKDPIVQRKIRELHNLFKKDGNTLILISPVVQLTEDLKCETTIIDFPLPEHEELEKIVGAMAKENELEIDDVYKKRVVGASAGLTCLQAENALAKSIYNTNAFEIDQINKAKSLQVKQDGILEYFESSNTMEDVGGFDNLKDWLDLRSQAFSDEAKKYGLVAPRGILLVGIPGCGKSLVAKSISTMFQFPLLKLDVGKIFGSLVGESESNMRRAIKIAEAMSPSILWIDEIEKGMAGSQSSGKTDSGVSARVFGTFLTWMQEKKESVFVVATANNISALPPEFLRKGRFDELFFVDLPNKNEREQIFEIHLTKKKRDARNFDIKNLSNLTDGFTGSEIEEIINSALYLAFSEKTEIEDKHIIISITNTIPLSKTMSSELNSIREWANGRAVNVSSIIDEKSNSNNTMGRRIRKIKKAL